MSNESIQELQARVARLEEEVQHLKGELERVTQPKQPWWERIAGSHANDPVFAEIVRLGAEIRRADRPPEPRGKTKKANPRKRKTQRVQSSR